MSDSSFYYLALNFVQGLGIKRIQALTQYFGSVESILQAPRQELEKVQGISLKLAEQIERAVDSRPFRQEWENIQSLKVKLWGVSHPNYSALLREIYAPPTVLYVLGDLDLNHGFPVAFVGSRKATYYGQKQTKRLIRQLAEQLPQAIIVSGMALGIDTVAHETAIECGLKTAAVLGGGLQQLYPPQNRKLADKISNNGALLTEYFMSSRPVAANFPIRNRIISGLSIGTVVIEAGERSGALITARNALEQNREVFALPGPVDSPSCRGSNRLIQKGNAKLIFGVEDILEELQIESDLKKEQVTFSETTPSSASSCNYSEEENLILSIMVESDCHIDTLAQRSGLPMNKLLATLTSLEMRGLVTGKTGATYMRLN